MGGTQGNFQKAASSVVNNGDNGSIVIGEYGKDWFTVYTDTSGSTVTPSTTQREKKVSIVIPASISGKYVLPFALVSYVVSDIDRAWAETAIATRNSDTSYSLWVNYTTSVVISVPFTVRVIVEGKLK